MKDQDFLQVIDATPLVSIDLIVENAEGKILLGKRNNKPAQGYWFVPGGRIRKNEALAQAFKRISSVELGNSLELTDATLLGAYDHIYSDNFSGLEGINTHYVALGHRIKVADDFQLVTDDQHSTTSWWSVEDLLESELVHPNTKLYFQS